MLDVEQVHIEMEAGTGSDSLAIEVRGAKDEWAGPVGEPAGSFAGCNGGEYAGVRRGAGGFAKHHAEGAAQYVGGFAGREDNGFFGVKMEAQPPELERHGVL
jgi:hypothetical protein